MFKKNSVITEDQRSARFEFWLPRVLGFLIILIFLLSRWMVDNTLRYILLNYLFTLLIFSLLYVSKEIPLLPKWYLRFGWLVVFAFFIVSIAVIIHTIHIIMAGLVLLSIYLIYLLLKKLCLS